MRLNRLFLPVFSLIILTAYALPNQAFAGVCSPTIITNFVGDVDALGTGTLPGNNLPNGPFDNRSPAEMAAIDGSEFTDQATGNAGMSLDFVDFIHNFAIPAGFTITSVDLEFGLGGMQTNDNNPLTKNNAEDGLFVDGVLIPDAFEPVNHGSFTYGIEPVVISAANFVQFIDGSATLRIDSNSFGGTNPAGGPSTISPIFYDYSKITITGCLAGGMTVGGEFLPIDFTVLVLAGLQTSAIWMLPVLAVAAAAGIAAFKIRKRI